MKYHILFCVDLQYWYFASVLQFLQSSQSICSQLILAFYFIYLFFKEQSKLLNHSMLSAGKVFLNIYFFLLKIENFNTTIRACRDDIFKNELRITLFFFSKHFSKLISCKCDTRDTSEISEKYLADQEIKSSFFLKWL